LWSLSYRFPNPSALLSLSSAVFAAEAHWAADARRGGIDQVASIEEFASVPQNLSVVFSL
jgi:hypothetical protein